MLVFEEYSPLRCSSEVDGSVGSPDGWAPGSGPRFAVGALKPVEKEKRLVWGVFLYGVGELLIFFVVSARRI